MIIKCSKYNEVNLKDIKHLIINSAQIVKSDINVGTYIDDINVSGKTIRLYSNDSVVINNVALCLAKADDSYFNCELHIN